MDFCGLCASQCRLTEFEGVTRCLCELECLCNLCGNRCKTVNMRQHVLGGRHGRNLARMGRAVRVAQALVAELVPPEVVADLALARIAAPGDAGDAPDLALARIEEPVVVVARPEGEVEAPADLALARIAEPPAGDAPDLALARMVEPARAEHEAQLRRFELERAEHESFIREVERERVLLELEALRAKKRKAELELEIVRRRQERMAGPVIKIEIPDSPPQDPTPAVASVASHEEPARKITRPCDWLLDERLRNFQTRAERMTAAGILSNPSSGTSQAEVPQFGPIERVEREEGELSEIPGDLGDILDMRPSFFADKFTVDIVNSLPKR